MIYWCKSARNSYVIPWKVVLLSLLATVRLSRRYPHISPRMSLFRVKDYISEFSFAGLNFKRVKTENSFLVNVWKSSLAVVALAFRPPVYTNLAKLRTDEVESLHLLLVSILVALNRWFSIENRAIQNRAIPRSLETLIGCDSGGNSANRILRDSAWLRFDFFFFAFLAAESLAIPDPRFWESCDSRFAILCR